MIVKNFQKSSEFNLILIFLFALIFLSQIADIRHLTCPINVSRDILCITYVFFNSPIFISQEDVYTRMQNLTSEPMARMVKLHPS